MGSTVSSIADAIARIYHSFVVRDLLGFVLPGSILILTFWIYIDCPRPHENRNMFEAIYNNIIYLDYKDNIDTNCTNIFIYLTRVIREPKLIPTTVFLVVSYITAWILQSVHYSILNILLLPKSYFYKKRKTIDSHFLITRMALKPDKDLERIRKIEVINKLEEGLYTERLSALLLMTGNLSLAGSLFFLVLFFHSPPEKKQSYILWIELAIMALVYFEHWRLWHARNLRHEIYVDVFKWL
jgi:hypothetical protein